MKKNSLIVLLAASVAAVSCLKGGGYESTYQLRATFERFDSYYAGDVYGDDKAYFEYNAVTEDNMVWFGCFYDEELKDFSGFGLSMATAEDVDFEGRYSVNADDASSGNVFALFHHNPDIQSASGGLMPDYHIFFATTEGTCTPVSCMVNNTKLVADKIAEYNSSHETPIEVTLTATGYLGGEKTGAADILLAGPEGSLDKNEDKDEGETSGSEESDESKAGTDAGEGEPQEPKWDIMDEWTEFDLSELGNIEYITFSLSFSDESQNLIPEYFCMDDFVANIHISISAE